MCGSIFKTNYLDKDKMKIFLVLVFIIIESCQGQHKSNQSSVNYNQEGYSSDSIVVNLEKLIHPIQPFFWGTNLLFWIDDDAALENVKIIKALDEMNIQLLRYPGGTVAENFH